MYITPRVKIQQEFLQVPVYAEFPLPAFIIGPNYALTRYSDSDEKKHTALGTYNGVMVDGGNSYVSAENTTYDFPNVPAGGDVDHSYTKVYAEAVKAIYFPLPSLSEAFSGSVAFVTHPVTTARYSNKVRFVGATLKTGNGYSRSSCFSNRDVAVHDLIDITDGTNVTQARVTAVSAETSDTDGNLSATVGAVIAEGSTTLPSSTPHPGQITNYYVFTVAAVDFSALDVVGKYLTIRHAKDSSGVYKIISLGATVHELVVDRAFAQLSGADRKWHINGVYNDIGNTPWECVEYNNGPSYTHTTPSANTTYTVANTSTAYFGYSAKGVLTDRYTATVTTEGNAAAVRFTITSEQGVFAAKYNVGLVADVLTIDLANGNVQRLDFDRGEDSATTFAVGDSWSYAVVAEVEPVNPVASGTYTGTTDMVYKLTVERGGAFYDATNASTCARLVITSSDVDTSSVVLPKLDTSFKLGSFGARATFEVGTAGVAAGELILGDIYYVPVTAARLGAYTVVTLSEDLAEATFLAANPTLTASLSVAQAAIRIPEVSDALLDLKNWTQEDSYITINSDITTYDSKLIAEGVPARLPITSAKLFVEHRDLLQDHIVAIDSVRDQAAVLQKLGTVHPDNPLAQAVSDAVLNSANQIVYFIGVGTNDLAGYTEAIRISEKSDKVYSFVPLTFNREIQDAVVGHVNAYSTPEVGRWRIAWLAVEDKKTSFMYNLKENGDPFTATVTDDPSVSGTQYRLVSVAGASFIDDGVRPNDTVRINFRSDSDGNSTYDEYVVDHVRTNTSLTVTKPLAVAISNPVKVQVVRNYTKSERANNIAHIGGDYNNRRVRVVFPDTYKDSEGVVKQGYIAAAGLAGLRSGVVPHLGLTNSQFYGAADLSKVVIEFSQDDLDTMAEQGIWIISQEVVGATAYVRHQLTTDTRSLNTSEDSITTNVDNISYALKHTLAPFIGRFNVNNENIAAVREAIVKELTYRASSTRVERAGNQLTSFTPQDDIILLAANSTYKDMIDVEVRLNVPYPINYINLKLIVG